jgi:hypothetical protein
MKESNLRRHFKRKHMDELHKCEKEVEDTRIRGVRKIDFPVQSRKSSANRLFALYAATTTFPIQGVENLYLKVCFAFSLFLHQFLLQNTMGSVLDLISIVFSIAETVEFHSWLQDALSAFVKCTDRE